MELFLIILIGLETLLVFVLIGLLFFKTTKLSSLSKEIKNLKTYDKYLEDVQRQRDDFLAMLVHELRSPLAVIKGASDLMLKDAYRLSKEQIETLLEQIKNSSTGLLKIVNDILDISKLESGKFEITKEENDLNAVLQDECDYYKSLANEKQIEILTKLDTTVGRFKFDADRIRQVMNNLLSNALKFTPNGGKVLVKSNKQNNRVFISICDDGPGITDEMKHRIFHKFVQGGDNHTKEKGTGLGLVISKGIIEAHGGTIWVEDNSPKGACFNFHIPIE